MRKDKNNINDIPLTDADYKGVVYEPSKDAKKIISNNSKKVQKEKPKKKIKKAQNFNFNGFIIFTTLLGVSIFGIVFYLTYSYLSPYVSFPSVNRETTMETIKLESQDDILNVNTDKNVLGMIRELDYETGLISMSTLSSSKMYTLKVKNTSTFKDKYGNMLTFQELKVGDIADFAFDSNNKVNYININKDTFSIDNISKFEMNDGNNTLKLNDATFNISKDAVVLKNGELIDIKEIKPMDIINIKGYNNTIYYIDMQKGTGLLKLINKPDIPNATIEIDRDIFKTLDSIDTINLKEGVHKVVIRGEGALSFVREVSIVANTQTILDLAQIKPMTGTLLIKSNVSDYTLYINNKEEKIREPLKLPYGLYSIRAEKEGYMPFETQVNLATDNLVVSVKLEKMEKMGKMSITSSPDGAQVFVDNTLAGYTPLKYNLPQGVHSIVLKKEGYNDFVLSGVNIGDEESSFNISMHKKLVDDTTQTTQQTTQTTSETTTN